MLTKKCKNCHITHFLDKTPWNFTWDFLHQHCWHGGKFFFSISGSEQSKLNFYKSTTSKNCIFMSFFYTNSHRRTKSYNFDSKCQWKAMTITVILAPSLGVAEFFIYGLLWCWLAGPPLNTCETGRRKTVKEVKSIFFSLRMQTSKFCANSEKKLRCCTTVRPLLVETLRYSYIHLLHYANLTSTAMHSGSA